ncbi:MAG: hypothetical protein SF066_09920 [Thermoanaerobaculia bacterium]|jgi:hypothetical protein|nr:hypothetical protein [Thermoanaerobaculia bacterium]
MSPLLKVERQIQELSPEELAQFRAWFAEFEAALWDRQIEEDARAGRLDHLADAALAAHARGETTEL